MLLVLARCLKVAGAEWIVWVGAGSCRVQKLGG